VWQALPAGGQAAGTVNVLSLAEGHGAVALQSAGQTWMLDCGSERDVARAVLPFLRYQGVQQLSGLLLTHTDSDHAGGAVALMQRCAPEAIFANLHEPWELDTRRTSLWKVQQKLEEQGGELLRLQEGNTLSLGKTELQVLYPRPQDIHPKADDRCMVMQLQLGPQRLLFCHDMGFLTERVLTNRYQADDLQSEVLLCDVHEGDGQLSAAFLDMVQPQCVISSSMPSAQLRAYCEKKQITLLQPQPLGMIQIQPEGSILRLKAWLTGEEWRTKPGPRAGSVAQ
jgi:competence protein ComEC